MTLRLADHLQSEPHRPRPRVSGAPGHDPRRRTWTGRGSGTRRCLRDRLGPGRHDGGADAGRAVIMRGATEGAGSISPRIPGISMWAPPPGSTASSSTMSQLRFFGGSSNHWHGRTRPLEATIFDRGPACPGSGWPITRPISILPGGADDILDITSPVTPDMPCRARSRRRIRSAGSPGGAARRPGSPQIPDEIAASQTSRSSLNANPVDLRLNAALDSVTGAVFSRSSPAIPASRSRRPATASASAGFENPRALLNFRSQIPEGSATGPGSSAGISTTMWRSRSPISR